jgi:hypothetical protein
MGTLVLALSLGLSGSVQDATPLPLEAAIALALE